MGKLKGNIKFDTVLLWLLGIIDIGYTVHGLWPEKKINENNLISLMLGVVLLYLGYERYKQRQKIEKPILELLARFGRLKVITGSVTELLISKISSAESIVRTGAWTNQTSEKEHIKDEYYKKLASILLVKNIQYYCAYNDNHNMEERRRSFKERLKYVSPNERKDVYRRMTYIPVPHQIPLNLMIIDTKTIIIGLRDKPSSLQTSLSIVIDCEEQADYKSAKEFHDLMSGIIHWYDKVLANYPPKKTSKVLKKDKNKKMTS